MILGDKKNGMERKRRRAKRSLHDDNEKRKYLIVLMNGV